jgi:3-dehydroquinate dehydratase type I
MTLLAQPPLVVGTIRPERLAALADLPAAERLADMVEARFDLADAAGALGTSSIPRPFLAACRQLERTGSPVLATIRLLADGGRSRVDAERLSWFDEAMAVTSWVDIELESTIAVQVVERAHARGVRVIVSHHDFSRTPEPETLDELIIQAGNLGADIVKVATMVTSLEDHDRLVDLLRRQRGRSPGRSPGESSGESSKDRLAAIAMGPVGTPLRSYLPCVGSRLTYGYLDEIAAPGQLHVRDLTHRLIADCPAYAAHQARKGWP